MNILSIALRGTLLGLVCLSAPLSAQLLSDPNQNWKEEGYTLPAAPKEAALREFSVSATTPHRFYVDEDSLSVGEDGVVRFVLVVRSAGGATSVTFEGIRCVTGERRLYASGRANGEWSPARNGAWEPIVDNSYDRPRAALAYDYLCDGPAPPRNRAAALKLLKTSQPGSRHFHEGIVR